MEPTTVRPTVLSAEAIAALPATPLGKGPPGKGPLGDGEGVTHTVLWRSDTSTAGRLTVPAGHRLGAHTHRVNHHHVWVAEGRVKILGAELGPGSYVHIPSGVEHDIDATNTGGCTLFYLYARPMG